MVIHIAVMDYCAGAIKMYHPDLGEEIQDENVEDWLHENTDYNDSSCYYMINKEPIKVIEGEVKMIKIYTWNELYQRAMEKGYGDPELEAKDTARYEVGITAEQYGVNIEEDECPEDAIDFFLAEHKEFDRFDVDGHMVNEKGERL